MTGQTLGAGLPGPILIVGGYGYRNMGDEAILAGLLRRLGPKSVSVVSRMPSETAAFHEVRAVGIFETPLALASHRSLLIGGGGLFGRDMGAIGRLLPGFGLLAQRLGRTVAIHGVGIDEGTPPLAATLLRRLSRGAAEVSVRDRRSAEILAEWGVEAVVVPDLSEDCPAAPREVGEQLLRASGLDLDRPIVGLCLTAVDAALARTVAEAVVSCVEAQPQVQFCFVPMSRHPFVPRHDDTVFGRSVQALAPGVRILQGVARPSELLSVFESLSVAVCMRYHSLLFAWRSAIPIVPIAYAPKCHIWLGEHGLAPIEPEAVSIREGIETAIAASAVQS
jgi:polysaccharide pyruvyl transferase WcaK-like protein